MSFASPVAPLRSRIPRRTAFVALSVVTLSAVTVPSVASAQASLLSGFGGRVGYGTECLGPNDDGSSMAIDLTPIFPTGVQFFDRTHTTMYVNTNGNVTFGDGVAAFTPSAFPIANQPMIAPYWADVDIRGTACVEPDGSGRPEYAYAGDCASPASNGVWWHLDVPGRRIVVTWDRVGYYRCHENRQMTFQLVLTAVGGTTCGGGGDFDVEFRFNECEWNTGDASGGMNGLPQPDAACTRVGPRWICPIGPTLACTGGSSRTCEAVPAQSGFDAGNLTDFVEIMGSRTDSIHTILCSMSNVSDPGVWRFQIRSGVVECPDAGDACDTGMMGVCGPGRTQCVGGGRACRPEVPASPERCDGLDNDCNGMVDDGAALCAALEVCDRGVCVGQCFEGSCLSGQTCSADGRCIDVGCETLTCPAGERCVAGACVAACDGIVCPAGTECRAGRCLDLCAGAVCDACTVCEGGDCVPSCEFASCPAGRTCMPDGRCVEDACVTVTCGAGEVCTGGTCTDACAGAVCPSGERCELGACVGMDRPDAGPPPDGSPLPDAGPISTIDAGIRFDGGVPPGVDGGPPAPPVERGCACRTTGRAPGGLGLALLVALGAIVGRRRRRA